MLNLSTVRVTGSRPARKQWGMSAIHPTMTRLYAAFEERTRAANPKARVGQSALARKLGTSPQVVKNWEARGISQRGAQKAQAILGVNATWILDGTGSPVVAPHAMPSQSAIPDPDILNEAMMLLAYDEAEAGVYLGRARGHRIAELYARILADGGRISAEATSEFRREVEARKQGIFHGGKSHGRGSAGRESK